MANPEAPKAEAPKEEVKNIDTKNSDVEELNGNPLLAKEEADKIVEGLPDTLEDLSPEQQKQFVNLVEHDFNLANLDIAPKNVENVPETIPSYWKQQVDLYTGVRKNFSKLSPDKQEALKKAEKNAISKMTEDSKNALESGWVMLWEREPDSAPDSESDSSIINQWNEL